MLIDLYEKIRLGLNLLIIFNVGSLPNDQILYVMTAGMQLLKSVLFDNTLNDNRPSGARW